MSTPTPSTATPQAAGKTTTQPPLGAQSVSTPAPRNPHLPGSATSTPRSITSPQTGISRPANGSGNNATTVAQTGNVSGFAAAKTPSSVQAMTPGPRTVGGTVMAPSLSQMSAASNASSGGGGGGVGGTNANANTYLPGSGGSGTSMPPSTNAGLGIGNTATATTTAALGVSPLAGLNFASPAGFSGMDIGTPSLLDPTAGLMGAPAMNMTLSELGITARNGGRNTEEERLQKTSAVLGKLLGRSNGQLVQGAINQRLSSGIGRISEEGIRRVGAWAGFDVEVEAKYNRPEFEGSRPIVIAGRNAVLIDVNLRDHIAQKVQVSFSSEQRAVLDHEKDAAKLLLRDLTPPTGIASINSKLDRFAASLETLARLDKLSSSQFNCMEALTGVHTSLTRLYEHEKKAAEVLLSTKEDLDDRARKHVMSHGCGVPAMHSSGYVGLGLEYFMDRSSIKISDSAENDSKTTNESDAMQLDDAPTQIGPKLDHKTYSLELTVEPSNGQLYTAARRSSDWLIVTSQQQEQTDTDPASIEPTTTSPSSSSIEWQDPSPTYLSPTTDEPLSGALDAIDPTRKLPNAIFVAKLHPAILVPASVAAELFQTVNAMHVPLTLQPQAYVAAALSGASLQPVVPLEARADLVSLASRRVYLPDADARAEAKARAQAGAVSMGVEETKNDNENARRRERSRVHSYSVYDVKPETAVLIQQFPFEHPRQVVQVLPLLRQWAFISRLINGCSRRSDDHDPLGGFENGNNFSASMPGVQGQGQVQRQQLTYEDLIQDPTADNPTRLDQAGLPVDISVSCQPIPLVTMVFQITRSDAHANADADADAHSNSNADTNLADALKVARITFQILIDAKVLIIDQNLIEERPVSNMEDTGMSDGDGTAGVGSANGIDDQTYMAKIEHMARALEICADIGIWIEWVRREHSRSP